MAASPNEQVSLSKALIIINNKLASIVWYRRILPSTCFEARACQRKWLQKLEVISPNSFQALCFDHVAKTLCMVHWGSIALLIREANLLWVLKGLRLSPPVWIPRPYAATATLSMMVAPYYDPGEKLLLDNQHGYLCRKSTVGIPFSLLGAPSYWR